MNFKNTEIKIDQIVNYLNDNKINLSPAFQRGHVWKKPQRQGLLKNILLGRPIPAIFLFKKSDGSKYLYNILDGKQRIESIILFITSTRNDLQIRDWQSYLFGSTLRKQSNFSVRIGDDDITFSELTDDLIRDFREYTIPTVEINLDDETGIDEIISLFVDINQQGVPVSRFDIVKAINKDSKFLRKAFSLIAAEQVRGQDIFYHMKDSNITKVIKQLSIVQNTADPKNKVDKIWQKLIEILIFASTNKHTKPADILKEFISQKDKLFVDTINKQLLTKVQKVFSFFWKLYKQKGFLSSPIVKDQTHFYTALTSVIKHDLINIIGEQKLLTKIIGFSNLLKDPKSDARFTQKIKKYQNFAGSHTTDTSRRQERENIFIDIVSKF